MIRLTCFVLQYFIERFVESFVFVLMSLPIGLKKIGEYRNSKVAFNYALIENIENLDAEFQTFKLFNFFYSFVWVYNLANFIELFLFPFFFFAQCLCFYQFSIRNELKDLPRKFKRCKNLEAYLLWNVQRFIHFLCTFVLLNFLLHKYHFLNQNYGWNHYIKQHSYNLCFKFLDVSLCIPCGNYCIPPFSAFLICA